MLRPSHETYLFWEDDLETVILNLFLDQLLQSLNVSFFLGLHVTPEFLEFVTPIRIGDVLVVSPQHIEAPAQLVNQVMIVISPPRGFAQMLHFAFCCKTHRFLLLSGWLEVRRIGR
jgi:hypothetical protein